MKAIKNLFSAWGTGSSASPLETAALFLVGIVVFLMPLFFIPNASALFTFSKTFLFAVFVLLALLFVITSQLKDRVVSIPLLPAFLGVWLIPVAYFVSSIFSANMRTSMVGQSLNADTFAFVAFGALLSTLALFLIQSSKQAGSIFAALIAAAVFISLYHVVRLFAGADFLSFGIFNTTTSTPLGSWNDLAVFYGLFVVMSLIAIMMGAVKGMLKGIVYLLLIVALFFLALINFSTAWWLVGFFALASFVYSVISRGPTQQTLELTGDGMKQIQEEKGGGRMSALSLLVLALALVFLFFSNSLDAYLGQTFNTNFIDIRPSWESTIEIGEEVYGSSPFFGSGANTFEKQWLTHKPESINESIFWNTRFTSGISYLSTSLITTGLLGALVWLLFFLSLAYTGARAFILSPMQNGFLQFVALSSFAGAVYLWVVAALYTPSVSLLALAFLLTGMFLGALRYNKSEFKELRISFVENPKLGFIAVLVLTVVFLGSIAALFSIGERYVAASSYAESIRIANTEGNLEGAFASVERAVSLDANDQYYRLAADITLAQIAALVNQTDAPNEELRSQFQILVGRAVQSAQAAIQIDETNDLNWFALARVYQTLAPLEVEGAYENGLRAFEEARIYNPESPLLVLEQARLELGEGNIEIGQMLIEEAIAKKSNYTDAIFLLSQVQVAQGEVADAIRSVQSAAVLNPQNPTLFFQLGLLEYSRNNVAEAAASLARAVSLDENYANARYFLGLSLYRLDDAEGAIAQFEAIEVLNPDNQDVKSILENLRAGIAPIEGVTRLSELGELPISEVVEAPAQELEQPIEESTGALE